MENTEIKEGYKGIGMCAACALQQSGKKNKTYCQKYRNFCRAVSKNCPGIPILKPEQGT